jgi:hypothetical protein
MGITSIAVLHNDFIGEMEREGGALGRKIAEAIMHWGLGRDSGDFRVGHVITMGHSGSHQIVIVHGNTGRNIYQIEEGLPYAPLEAMADCLKRHGWSAAPPPKEKKARKR